MSVPVSITVNYLGPDPVRELAAMARANPCAFTGHRPAHLVDGGIECYDCGVKFA